MATASTPPSGPRASSQARSAVLQAVDRGHRARRRRPGAPRAGRPPCGHGPRRPGRWGSRPARAATEGARPSSPRRDAASSRARRSAVSAGSSPSPAATEQAELPGAPRREGRALGAPHDALKLRVAAIAEGLGEPDHRRRAAVRGVGDLVGREQRQVGEVVGQVAGQGLLGRAEAARSRGGAGRPASGRPGASPKRHSPSPRVGLPGPGPATWSAARGWSRTRPRCACAPPRGRPAAGRRG